MFYTVHMVLRCLLCHMYMGVELSNMSIFSMQFNLNYTDTTG